jgi:Lon-like ATP-dependent protease
MQVVAVPLTRRPLFPGFYVPITIKDPKLSEKLAELKAAGTPWVGTFLLKDAKAKDGSTVLTAAEGGEATEHLRGEELFKRLHEYGTFAQVLDYSFPFCLTLFADCFIHFSGCLFISPICGL